jgi:serine/threonine protein kinase
MTQALCSYCDCVREFSNEERQLILQSSNEQLEKLPTLYTSKDFSKISPTEFFAKIKYIVDLLLSSLNHEGCGRILNDEDEKTCFIGYIDGKELKIWQVASRSFAEGTYSSVFSARSLLDPSSPPMAYKESKLVSKEFPEKHVTKSISDLVCEYNFHNHLDDMELKEKIRPAPVMIFGGTYHFESKPYTKRGHLSPLYKTFSQKIFSTDLDRSQKVGICAELISIIFTLHTKKIAFCDLKPGNLFGDGKKFFAADLASLRKAGDPGITQPSPYYSFINDYNRLIAVWMQLKQEKPPSEETLRLKAIYQNEIDIAALAIILFEICTKTHPFKLHNTKKGCLLPTHFDMQVEALKSNGLEAIAPLLIQMVSYNDKAPAGEGRIDIRTVQKIFNSLNFKESAACVEQTSSHS